MIRDGKTTTESVVNEVGFIHSKSEQITSKAEGIMVLEAGDGGLHLLDVHDIYFVQWLRARKGVVYYQAALSK